MSLNSLFVLVGKDLKLFFRSRVSSVVVLLIPLLIILFVGYTFNSNELSNVKVGVYSDSYSDFSNEIINDFEKDGFMQERYPSVDLCVESVKHSESQICVIFPADLSNDVSNDEIVFYADYSRINLADNLVNKIKGNVFVKTSGVGEDIAQELIDSLENVKTSLPAIGAKINKGLIDARVSRDAGLNIESPIGDISSIISDLKNVKNDINDSGTEKDIDDIIVTLTEIETEEEKFSDDLESVSVGQSQVVSKLTEVSSELGELIVTLNSGRVVSSGEIVSPINTKIESISADSGNRDFIIPIVFSLIALFGSVLLSSTFVLKGKKTRAFFRNFMAPVWDFVFILATYLTCLIILSLQFIFVFIGIKYVLGMDIFSSWGPLLVVLLLSLSAFITIGMGIGYLFRSDETVIFASMITAALLMFFSNVILPLENVSAGMLNILKFNPLVVSSLAMKKVILFGFGFDAIKNELLILGIWFVVFFVLSYVFRKITKRGM